MTFSRRDAEEQRTVRESAGNTERGTWNHGFLLTAKRLIVIVFVLSEEREA